ncbi:MAG: hypothetical protein AAF901_07960 [Bacteroidota bacterium]
MKHYIALAMLIVIPLTSFTISAQVGIGTTSPDASAALHIESSDSGILVPKLDETERDNITNPANGLMIFNTDANTFQYNSGTPALPVWVNVSYNASLKYSNTDVATNINTAASTNIPIFGNLEWNDNATLYTVAGNTVTVNAAGRYRIVANISYDVPTVGGNSDQRVAVEAQLAVNGTTTGTIAATGYVRHNAGHLEASLHITEVLQLADGDQISIQTIRSGNSAAANMRSVGTSNIYIERL